MTEDMWTATMAAEDLPGGRPRPTGDQIGPQVSPEGLRRFLLKRCEAAGGTGKDHTVERYVESCIKRLIKDRLKLLPYLDLERRAQKLVATGGAL